MKTIEISTVVDSSIEKAWTYWTKPEHIQNWNFASPDWHCPKAESELKEGGRFSSRMEAKDGSMGFDFGGHYTKIVPNSTLEYTLDDGREVSIKFSENNGKTKIVETFEPENQNPLDLQRQGWHAILNNFKNYVESN
ncbi:SRPBCC family protein [Maribacter litopenaei]|uniref:SRPBCC family protein n=1 Tax=Maribacter litopenaei TaxID=2976127 RepID=A0ABY5Y8J8_9FLAO|nr:SRPBCC family protein [Maribacter litopenaei]UWX55342.1 SRPBCC family protein [Maribacter litopenaei]